MPYMRSTSKKNEPTSQCWGLLKNQRGKADGRQRMRRLAQKVKIMTYYLASTKETKQHEK